MRLAVNGWIVIAALAGLVAPPASAQVLYKLISKDGKVTYAQEAPKDFDGQVIRIDVNPQSNTATLPKPKPGEFTPPADNSKAVRESKERLERARKALEEARAHPGEDDIRFVGKVGGGSRAVPTQAYQQRLEELERAVEEAQDDLKKVEGER